MDDQPRQQHTRKSEAGPPEAGPPEAGPPEADPFGRTSGLTGIEHQCVELCPICRTADVLRATLPPEFHEQWHAFQREAMLALRAALDHYIAHLDSEPDGEPPVEDIPIG